MRRSLPHTKRVRAKGKEYVYFKTGQLNDAGNPIYKRLPALRDPSFGAVYAAHLAQLTKRAQGSSILTLPQLADMYQKSPQYRKLSAGTHKIYGIYLDRLRALLPTAPADAVERSDIRRLMDNMADTPGAANMVLASCAALYKWARGRGHVTNRPTLDVEPFELGEHEPWPIDLVEAALSCDDPRVRLATHLLYFTAQRIGDTSNMLWSHIKSERIAVKVQKTGKHLDIPLHPRLAAELEQTPRCGLTILTDRDGSRLTEEVIRSALKAFAAKRGHKVVPHGLRKNAVNTLLECGCSAAETAAISGQSLQMIEHYSKQRAQGALATAAILKWQGANK